MSAKPQPGPVGVGMPEWLYLNEFALEVERFFGRRPMLVGSALETKAPRDIDVRLVLDDDDYEARVGPIHHVNLPGTCWAAICMAFSALGQRYTGLRVDFQVQPAIVVAAQHDEAKPRYELGGKR